MAYWILASLALGLADASSATAQVQDEFRWHGKIAAGRAIEIQGVNGSVHAIGGSGGEVQVTASKRSRRSNVDDVEIRVVEHEEGVTICAVYPNRRSSRPNDCRPGGRSHMNTDDNDVEVEFQVRVPETVRFVGRTVNGSVSAEGLGADAEAYSVNGGVNVSTRGMAQATTVNGSIIVVMNRADWPDELAFTTVNGGITLTMPAALSAEFSAETVNGGIDSDFPLTLTGKVNPRHLRGTIGGGGGHGLRLSTVNGTIRLRKGT